jgi:hypothetical protein
MSTKETLLRFVRSGIDAAFEKCKLGTLPSAASQGSRMICQSSIIKS